LRGNFFVAAHLQVRLTSRFLRAWHGRGERRSPEMDVRQDAPTIVTIVLMIFKGSSRLAEFKGLPEFTEGGRAPIFRQAREGGNPEGIERTGFLFLRNDDIRPNRNFSAK